MLRSHALLLLLLSSPLAASEMLVFKLDSQYRGGAMRIASYQKQGDRLIIRDEKGQVFSAPASSVDWERSRLATERMHAEDQVAAERAAVEAARQKAIDAASETETMSVLEASRRYGVDKPAISTSRNLGPELTAPASTASGTAAVKEDGAGGDARLEAAMDRVKTLKEQKAALAKDLAAVQADNNPDPLAAANRTSRIADLQQRNLQMDKDMQAAEAEVQAARAAANKAKAAAPAAAPSTAAK